MDKEFDLILGLHSIADAIKSSDRSFKKLICTKDGLKSLKSQNYFDSSLLSNIDVDETTPHEFQEKCKKLFKQSGFEYRRIANSLCLQTSPLKFGEMGELYRELESGKALKIICLDQVTDVHNAAAILRTSSFFGVDYVILGKKGNFGITPSFYRISSGSTEHVKLVTTSNLSRLITKLQEKDVRCIGLSEHADDVEISKVSEGSTCLVFGSEDRGLSHAVMKALDQNISLKALGNTPSLNVSVAVAVTLEKIFGN